MASPIQTSVVLPVYQGGAFLRKAVESVLAQTGASFELIVGDDASTDGSRAYLESLRDPRVRFFPGKGRSGLFPHLNRLLPRCRGAILRFFCQDDILETECLAKEAAFFEQHADAGMLITKYRTIGTHGEVLSENELRDLPDILPSMLAVQQLYYHGCIAGNLSTVSLRATVLKEVGLFNETFRVSGDYDLWARVAPRHAVGLLHQHLVRIRSHERQLSRSRQSAVPFVLENARVRKQLLPFLPLKARDAAMRFEKRRHQVLDFHLALRCALEGRWKEARAIFGALGQWGSIRAMAFWAWTLNNRRRPQAPWVLP